jgi:hypothetical protein
LQFAGELKTGPAGEWFFLQATARTSPPCESRFCVNLKAWTYLWADWKIICKNLVAGLLLGHEETNAPYLQAG